MAVIRLRLRPAAAVLATLEKGGLRRLESKKVIAIATAFFRGRRQLACATERQFSESTDSDPRGATSPLTRYPASSSGAAASCARGQRRTSLPLR